MIIKVRNRAIRNYNNFQLTLKYDAVASAFSFSWLFDPADPVQKEIARPGAYHPVVIEHNGERLLTGYMISQTFTASEVKKLAAIGGYSIAGVLEDCEIPPSLYPLQSDGLSLREIAKKLIEPFGIKMVVDESRVGALMDEAYETATAGETETVKSFLTKLAAQKNIILTHNAFGNLVFTEAKGDTRPLIHFQPGSGGAISMALAFNGQAMFSDITVLLQSEVEGENAGEATVKNPYVSLFRPKVVSQSAGDNNDTEKAANNALAAQLQNIRLTIELNSWEIEGKVVKPNTVIAVTNPELYLYDKTLWFVEEVELRGNAQNETATLKCVPPQVYNEQKPFNIFL